MSVPLIVNGTTYNYPSNHQAAGWGAEATGWATAVTDGLLPKIGGTFELTGEVNFGATYGLRSQYFKDAAANPAASGVLRLANGSTIKWRNNANTADLSLTANSSDILTFGGTALVLTNDARFSPNNLVTVQTNPGAGEFSSIKDAVDYVVATGSPSYGNQWLVYVQPGLYVEDPITTALGVHVGGLTSDTVIVTPTDPTQPIFTMAMLSSLADMSIAGANGTGGVGVKIYDVYSTLSNIRLYSNTIDLDMSGTIGHAAALLANVTFESRDNARVHGIKAVSSGSGLAAIVVRGSLLIDTASTGALVSHIYASGVGTQFLFTSTTFAGQGISGIAIELSDGALISGNVSIDGYTKGLVVNNVGAAPAITAELAIIHTSSLDIDIAHPGTTGFISGSFDKTKVVVNSSAPIAFSYNSVGTETGLVNTGNLFIGDMANDITNVTDLIQESTPDGVISGGQISSSVNPLDVSVAAGYGYVEDITTGKSKRVEWSITILTIPDNVVRYVIINNSGVPVVVSAPGDIVQTIILGRIRTSGGTIQLLANIPQNSHHPSNYIDNFIRSAIGPIFTSGSIVVENPSVAREINVNGGVYWYGQQELLPSGGDALSFYTFYHDGGDFIQGTTVSVVDNTKYDDGTDLQNLTASYYTKHSIWLAGDGANERYALVYGIDQWATLLEAETAPLASPPSFFTDIAVPIAAIIVRQGTTHFSEIIDIRPRIGFQSPSSSTSTDHGNLSGLLDDDHPQYLLADGTRPLSANWSLGGYNLTSIGTMNGVAIASHASRHLPNGADAITTAAPTADLTASTTNTVGTANSLARSDHSHAITGFQPVDATLTALAAFNSNGILTQTAADTFTARTITGTTNKISVTNGTGVSGNPTIDIDAAYVGQTSITTLGTITTGTWNGAVIGGTYGGTGVNNGSKTITLGGNLVTSGAFNTTITVTADTNVTLPTSGTLVNTAVTTLSSLASIGTITTGVWNGTTIDNTHGGTGQTSYTLGDILYSSATNTLGKLAGNTTTTKKFLRQTGNGTISAAPAWDTVTATDVGLGSVENTALSTWAGSTNIVTLGTISTGTWHGVVIGSTYGGTGVNNGSSTITLGGNLVTSGAFNTTLTVTAATSVTLPTSGTLVNTAVTTLSSLASIGTITTGTWNGTVITGTYGGTGVNNGSKTITLGGNLVTSGAFNTTLTVTADTNVTLPTSGTLVNTAVTTLSSLASIGTITTGVWNGTVITGTYGGTGVNNGSKTIALGGNLVTSGAFNTTFTVTADTNVTFPTSGTLVNTGVTTLSSLVSIGTITTGVWNGTAIDYTHGGTGQTSYTTGDILYASATNTLSKLAGIATGNVLLSGGVATAPSWGKVGLTTHVTGTLNATNGGTGVATYTLGDILYSNGTNSLGVLSGNTTTTKKFLRQTGNGTISAIPAWDTVTASDITQLYAENPSTPTTPSATGANAVAIGSGAAASAIAGLGVGDGSSASIWGGKVFANGKFATAGDAQHGLYVVRAITTDATANVELFLDGAGASQRLVVANNSVWTFDILVSARRTDNTGGGAGYRFVGALRKDTTSASIALIGTPSKTVVGETNTAWDAAVTIDTTNGSLKIAVTGEVSKTIRWVAVVNTSEVTN